MDARFGDVDKRLADVDRRFADVDQRFNEIDRRLDQVDRRFEETKELWRSELRRVEQVLDARLEHIEQDLSPLASFYRKFGMTVTEP